MPRTHADLRRLYVDTDLSTGMSLSLDKDQSNYLAAVLRMQAGDPVVVFNGREGAFLAAVEHAGKRATTLLVGEQIAAQTPPSELHVHFAPIKTGRLEYVVQKATEMGAGLLEPVITQFTQVSRLNLDRLRANIIEAAEQCEVLTVPELAPEIRFDALLRRYREAGEGRVLIVADESRAAASPLDDLMALRGTPPGLLIGPEGGFSETERAALLAADFVRPISLGPRILRADTALVAAMAVIQASIGDWR